jgi:hypothetical protein
MRIGELADAVGVNPKTIRYYESIRLLPGPDRRAVGYRDYGEEDIEHLAFVRRPRDDGRSQTLTIPAETAIACGSFRRVVTHERDGSSLQGDVAAHGPP